MANGNMVWPRLHRMAADCDVEGLKVELQRRTDPNDRREDGATALHIAAGRGEQRAVRLLLEHGANPNARTHSGATPLEFAVKHHPETIQLLIERGADPDAGGEDGKTPLWVAVDGEGTDAIGALIAGGADPSCTVLDGLTTLCYAARKGSHAAASALVAKAPQTVHDRDVCGLTPLHHAAISGHRLVIEKLLNASADMGSRSAEGETPLHLAASCDRVDAVKALLVQGACPNARDRHRFTPLHLAARDAGVETLEILLEATGGKPDDPSTPGATPFHLAVVHNGNPEVAVALLNAGADQNAEFDAELGVDDSTPIAVAARAGNRVLVETLIAKGANANDERGDQSPLAAAVSSGEIGTVRVLLGARADPEGRATGFRPLLDAADGGHLEIVSALLDAGADPNVAEDDMTALHHAVESNSEDMARIVDLLLRHGASQREPYGAMHDPPLHLALAKDVPNPSCIGVLFKNAVGTMDQWEGGLDYLGDESWTPLHAAASNPNVIGGVVDGLIGRGCNPEAVTTRFGGDLTALDLAAKCGSLTAMDELLNRGVSADGVDDSLTPLVCAIEGGFSKAVKVLLANGAKVDDTELVALALKNGNVELARIVVGAALEDEGGLRESTPLHWAAAYGASPNVLAQYMESPANLRAKDGMGWSPLHWAARSNHSHDVIRWLLEAGANPRAATVDGETPYDIANDHVNQRAMEILPKHSRRSGSRGRSRPRGTPGSDFTHPILQALIEMGGSGERRQVLDRVEQIMASRLGDYDREPVQGRLRWERTAERRVSAMKKQDFLQRVSRRGWWEVSDRGRAIRNTQT